MELIEEYIEKYCRKHEISREEALTHACVKNYAEYLKSVENGKITTTDIKAGCGGANNG